LVLKISKAIFPKCFYPSTETVVGQLNVRYLTPLLYRFLTQQFTATDTILYTGQYLTWNDIGLELLGLIELMLRISNYLE
jgi:hypothetical protein